MDLVIICFAVFFSAILTFFSGFGLGTIMLPVLVLFFPVPVAVALTGAIHFTNSSFKATVTGRNADRNTVVRFGIPAIAASFAGALLLGKIAHMEPLFQYTIATRNFEITPVKLIIALILLVFSLMEFFPSTGKIKPGTGTLIPGGLLSGFFGGLAGMQGALRGAFLVRAGLSGQAYIATSAVIAMLVDLTRLPVYFSQLSGTILKENLWLVVCSVISGIAGAYAGTMLLKKITMRFIQVLVTVLLVIISVLLGLGLI